MLRRRIYFYRRLNITADILITAAAYLLANFLLTYIMGDKGLGFAPHYLRYLWIMYPLALLWPLLLNINGLYPTNRLRTAGRAMLIILKSGLQGFVIVFAFLFIFKLHHISRLLLGVFAVMATTMLILKECFVIGYLRFLRELGMNLRNILIIGSLASVKSVIDTIVQNYFLGLKITGVLLPAAEAKRKEVLGQPVLGSLEDIENVLHRNPIDNVLITIDRKDYKEVDDIISHCEEEGVEIWLTASIFNIKIAHLDSDKLFEEPIFILRTGPKFSLFLFTKGVLDKAGSLILGILSLPLIIIAAVLIKSTSKGPVIYKQKRCGVQGREFTLYKLRTMYIGADKEKYKLKAESVMKGPAFKMERDPRITPVGWILRKFSIDETPQFWNVLKGDMSLIGPRPPVPEEVHEYKGWQRRRLSMKPGISGLWQVSGRSQIVDFDKLAELDLKYIDNWSLLLDFNILLRTIIVVISTRGAK